MSGEQAEPLMDGELALFREGLRDLKPLVSDEVLPLHEITRREWMHRCARLLATLDAARSAPEPGEGLRAALTTALSVALHEEADPDCTGNPPYDATAHQAEQLIEAMWRTPIVRAALSSQPEPGEGGERALRTVIGEPCRFLDIDGPKPYCAVHGGWWVYGYCDLALLERPDDPEEPE